MKPRFEKPIKHQGKIVRCNCNADWDEDQEKVISFVENKRYGDYMCPKCLCYPWILVDEEEKEREDENKKN